MSLFLSYGLRIVGKGEKYMGTSRREKYIVHVILVLSMVLRASTLFQLTEHRILQVLRCIIGLEAVHMGILTEISGRSVRRF